jgi:hypothetical protein
MKRSKMWALAVLGVLAGAGCGRPFKVETAPGFVELGDQQPEYDYRATTPEGVVVAVKTVDLPDQHQSLDFWVHAVTLEMRDVKGYALLETVDIVARDGTKGKQLRFGHDEDRKPFVYWLTLYVAQDRLFLVESGGAKDAFERNRAGVEWTHASLKVRCDTFVSPVLASRTCNRW